VDLIYVFDLSVVILQRLWIHWKDDSQLDCDTDGKKYTYLLHVNEYLN